MKCTESTTSRYSWTMGSDEPSSVMSAMIDVVIGEVLPYEKGGLCVASQK